MISKSSSSKSLVGMLQRTHPHTATKQPALALSIFPMQEQDSQVTDISMFLEPFQAQNNRGTF